MLAVAVVAVVTTPISASNISIPTSRTPNGSSGEGSRAYMKVYADMARAEADMSDKLRASAASIPVPTAAQLQYQQQELVALTHFNMATFYKNGDPACDPSNWAESQLPSSFAPTNLNMSNWIESYKALGARSGILTAKHGCGFLLWPTKVTLPNGDNYGYHVGNGIGVDLADMYVKSMRAAGLRPSFYYSLKDSYYLNAIHDNVRPPATLIKGQVNVTQEEFESISVAAVTELWSKYGELAEIWFDGGISERIKSRIVPLLASLQPNAVTMGAGIENSPNDVSWVGTESGTPKYPVWSTGCAAPGAGSRGIEPGATGSGAFCPKCGDCTLQAPDTWFWEPNQPIKPLSTLINMYHHTVGQNGVMELDFAIDRTGNVDPTHAKAYAAFGSWIRACYDKPVGGKGFTNTTVLEVSLPGNGHTIDRVAIQEDLKFGQRVTAYKVEARQMGSAAWRPFGSDKTDSGSAVGHKKIDIVETPLLHVTALRLTITSTVASLMPSISLRAFAPCPKG